jgi:LysR family nitrogen assimilation transcriptional regulator
MQFEPVFQVDSVSLTKEMVRKGLGCAVLPSVAVRDEVARGTLVFRPIDHVSLVTTHAIAVRQTTTESAVLGFLDVLREAIRSLVASGVWPGARILKPQPKSVCADREQRVQTDAWQLPAPAALARALEHLEGD